jgi:hypothetical protein
MMKSKDLASVASKLEVPLIISDLLSGNEPMTDEAEYALHEAISEMQPDSALLCIALCGAKFTSVRGMASPAIRLLEMECRKIIDEYAMLWLHNAESGEVDEGQAFETLSGAAEDLEDLAGLFDNCVSYLERTNGDVAIICDIMSVQARSQALVAEAYFEALNDEPEFEVEAKVEVPVALPSNVIKFPLHRTA